MVAAYITLPARMSVLKVYSGMVPDPEHRRLPSIGPGDGASPPDPCYLPRPLSFRVRSTMTYVEPGFDVGGSGSPRTVVTS